MRKHLWGGYTPIRFITGLSQRAIVLAVVWLVLMAALGVAVSSVDVSVALSRMGW